MNNRSDAMPKAKRALVIIWSTGIGCIIVGVLFFLDLFTSSLQNDNPSPFIRQDAQEEKSIDQLLLSSDEALLSDKKSFVNVALRFQGNNQAADINENDNRAILYDNILKKKLQRVHRAEVSDFSIRPVPK